MKLSVRKKEKEKEDFWRGALDKEKEKEAFSAGCVGKEKEKEACPKMKRKKRNDKNLPFLSFSFFSFFPLSFSGTLLSIFYNNFIYKSAKVVYLTLLRLYKVVKGRR